MATITIHYFGMLESLTGKAEDRVDIPAGWSVGQLLEHLDRQYSGLRDKCFRVAVNDVIQSGERVIDEGDRIAFMPPFAGG